MLWINLSLTNTALYTKASGHTKFIPGRTDITICPDQNYCNVQLRNLSCPWTSLPASITVFCLVPDQEIVTICALPETVGGSQPVSVNVTMRKCWKLLVFYLFQHSYIQPFLENDCQTDTTDTYRCIWYRLMTGRKLRVLCFRKGMWSGSVCFPFSVWKRIRHLPADHP